MSNPACMGGWCRLRDRCARHLQADRREPAERLCPAGDPVEFLPISTPEPEPEPTRRAGIRVCGVLVAPPPIPQWRLPVYRPHPWRRGIKEAA